MSAQPEMLCVEDLQSGYGDALALSGVSLKVAQGEIALVLGPNGSGKTTLVWTIMGQLAAAGGRVAFKGRDITRDSTLARAKAGLAVVPQGGGLFPGLSVGEHLVIGSLSRGNHHLARRREFVLDLFRDLQNRLHSPANQLSGGQRQMLSIGRALMSEPEFLLLDEPSVGLAPAAAARLFAALGQVNRDEGTTMLLVEQNLAAVHDIVSSAYLMTTGRIVSEIRDPGELKQADVWRALTTKPM